MVPRFEVKRSPISKILTAVHPGVAQVCLEYLAKAVELERLESQKVAESFGSPDGREIAAELRAREEGELDVPEL